MDPKYLEILRQREVPYEKFLEGETPLPAIGSCGISSPDLFERVIREVSHHGSRDGRSKIDVLFRIFIELCETNKIPFIRILLKYVTIEELTNGYLTNRLCTSIVYFGWIDLLEFLFTEAKLPVSSMYLDRAIREKKYDVIDVLLKYGVNVNGEIKEYDRSLPVHTACQFGDKTLIKKLIIHGADFTISDEAGETPLQRAVTLGRYSIANYIIKVYPSLISTVAIDHHELFVYYVMKLLSKRSFFRTLFMRISCQ